MKLKLKSRLFAFVIASVIFTQNDIAKADEGMWTFDAFPSQKVMQDYGFNPNQRWLNHIQNSAIRLSTGCSASFVSPNGLILTNWHCAAKCVEKLSNQEIDYSQAGFIAAKIEDEKQCPAMQAEVLTEIKDVTQRIQNAIKDKPSTEIANLRDIEIANAEMDACEDLDETKYRCDVINLYRGGQYKIYIYRIYTDVRLVFAPEREVGFFGGDPDNFNFPRYSLDAAFLRAYENGEPLKNNSFLKWNNQSPNEGDLVFVAGSPGSTQRLKTIDQLEFQRDWVLPIRQIISSELRGRLIEYMSNSDSNHREANQSLFSLENRFKSQYGQMRSLMDKDFFSIKENQENDLRRLVSQNPALSQSIGDPWAQIVEAGKRQRELFLKYEFLESRPSTFSELFYFARTIVRASAEREKPVAERLAGYTDASIAMMERRLSAYTPIYNDQERIGLETWLSKTREYLSVDAPEVKNILGRESPENLARRLVSDTHLGDIDFRTNLMSATYEEVRASNDPMIKFALQIDENARAIRQTYLNEVDGPIAQASQKIAESYFAIYGTNAYPDATFTLRLSYGKVQGWAYNGQNTPAFTYFNGLYERANGSQPYIIAPRWQEARNRINPDIKFDLVTTNDIIGGNSGSPLIDKEAQVIGVVFDGNIHSLGGDFVYEGRTNRAISVTSTAIEEALSKVYGLDRIVTELNAAPRPRRSR